MPTWPTSPRSKRAAASPNASTARNDAQFPLAPGFCSDAAVRLLLALVSVGDADTVARPARIPTPATGAGEARAVGRGGVGERPFEGFAPTGPAPKNPAAQKTAPDQTTDAISHGRPKCRCGKAYGGIPASHEAAVVAPGKSWASTRNSHGFQQCRFRGQSPVVLSVAAL